jgi:hypothetical protein
MLIAVSFIMKVGHHLNFHEYWNGEIVIEIKGNSRKKIKIGS